MTTEQPEALRIADLFEVFGTNELAKKAAAELRRLHAKNVVLVTQLSSSLEEINRVIEQRDELLKGRQMLGVDNIRLQHENKQLRKAVTKLHAARGRFHTQIAACDLYDLLGLKNERPTK